MTFENYVAVADKEIALAIAETDSPFTIEVRFLGGLTETQKSAFKLAADRWTKVIVGDLPQVQFNGELIDDLLIEAEGIEIDGPRGILGQAGPTILRPAGAGAAAFLPAMGQMQFDTADLEQMEQIGTLNDVITHEMGHVLGIGTVWTRKGLLDNTDPTNPTFTGPLAMAEYGILHNAAGPEPVPVENTGGPGTKGSHWRESLFRAELMSGFIAAPGNPMSRVTVASLADLGYVVDMTAAEDYQLPVLAALAEGGALRGFASTFAQGVVLPSLPRTLPETSLV